MCVPVHLRRMQDVDTRMKSAEFPELPKGKGVGWGAKQTRFGFSEVTSRDSPASAFRERKAGPAAAHSDPAATWLCPFRRAGRDPPSSSRRPRSAPGLAPPPPAPDDPRRRRQRLRATHMCGFLLKALVMSFTTRCTSTATSSLVSAMLAAAAAAGARLRDGAVQPAGFRGERARVRRFGGAPASAPAAAAAAVAAEDFRVSPPAAGRGARPHGAAGVVPDFLSWHRSECVLASEKMLQIQLQRHLRPLFCTFYFHF